MEFRQIRYATTVAKEGSFTKAAERLHISQSAVSEQVKLLEDRIGFALLERTGRGVNVTERGQIFLHEAERVANDLVYLLDVARYLRDESADKLVIGIISGLASAILPRMFPEGAMPANTLLEVQTAPTRVIFDHLYAGRIDIGFAIAVDPDLVPAGLTVKRLFENDLVLVTQPGHPFTSDDKPVDITQLSQEPIIMSDLSVGYGVTVMTMLGDIGVHPHITAVVDNIETMKVMAQAGVGHALIPAAAVENERRLGLLGVTPISPPHQVTVESYRQRLGLSKRKELLYTNIVSGFCKSEEPS